MPSYYEWTFSRKENKDGRPSPSFIVSIHPLKSSNSHTLLSSNKSFIENLNKWSSGFEELDPLLRFEKMSIEQDLQPEDVQLGVNYSKVWNTKRQAILNKYTTGEKLTILSSFLPGGEKALIRQVSNLNEKVKHRLEQLDEFEESSIHKTIGLSQQEYVAKINQLSDEIKKAWDTEQRVKAFKIVIQCSKMLSDMSVMQFYPSKFALITDILDTFGELVFNRLKIKSFGPHQVISIEDIDPREVPEAARETCQNWIYKMASIRELLPRMLMEMALIKCYLFIEKKEIKPTITRLTMMIRGIGNPLVAVYLRLYLCRVASKLLKKDCEEYFYENLQEFITDYEQIFHPMMKKKYETQLLDIEKYLNLYVPAVDWLLFGSLNSNRNKYTLLEELLKQCRETQNSELLLSCTVSAFDSESIVEKASEILEIVKSYGDKNVLTCEVVSALGEHVCAAGAASVGAGAASVGAGAASVGAAGVGAGAASVGAGAASVGPGAARRGQVERLVHSAWAACSAAPSTHHFLHVLEPWLQVACTHLSCVHVNALLRGSIKYVCGRRGAELAAASLARLLRRMLAAAPHPDELLLCDAFMPLVELVETSSARVLMAKTVLSVFFQRHTQQLEDHIVIASLMRLCCILHDSINAVTVEDECKICADLITKFVYAVSYGDDYEQTLNFYVDCRAAFIKLDSVLVALVHSVNALSCRTSASKDKWLHRACAAYCFVTVPSLHCTLQKVQLYLLSGQTALLNNCVGQAEANFKTLIGLIPDIPEFIFEDAQKKPTSTRVTGLLSNFLSTLLVLPDNVDSNCKAYVLSGFIKLMERIHWIKTDSLYYSTLLKVLDLLSAMAQENYAYHLDSVISNDKLYGSDPEFLKTIDNFATNICQELLVVLKMLGEQKESKKQHALALELFWRVSKRGDLNEESMLGLAVNLWGLTKKDYSTDKLNKSILTALENDKDPVKRLLLEKLQV